MNPAWVFGFPELSAEQPQRIRDARYVANPGCYSTGAISLLAPLTVGLAVLRSVVTVTGGVNVIDATEATAEQRGMASGLFNMGKDLGALSGPLFGGLVSALFPPWFEKRTALVDRREAAEAPKPAPQRASPPDVGAPTLALDVPAVSRHDEPFPVEVDPSIGPVPASMGRTALRQQVPSWNASVLDRSIKRTLQRQDGTRPVVAHSGVAPHPPKLDGTDTHLTFGWGGGDERQLPGFARLLPRFVRFVSELGAASVPVTDDFVDHGSPVPIPPGPAGYAQILGFVTQVLDVRYDIRDLICTEDRIVVRAVGHGRAVAAVHGADVAGQAYEMDTLHVYRTEGDRLAEHWGVRDELGVLIRLGVLPAPRVDLAAEVNA